MCLSKLVHNVNPMFMLHPLVDNMRWDGNQYDCFEKIKKMAKV